MLGSPVGEVMKAQAKLSLLETIKELFSNFIKLQGLRSKYSKLQGDLKLVKVCI